METGRRTTGRVKRRDETETDTLHVCTYLILFQECKVAFVLTRRHRVQPHRDGLAAVPKFGAEHWFHIIRQLESMHD